MSEFRKPFFDRTTIIDKLLDHEKLVDKAPNERSHNDGARVLRNGLSVIAFSTLEEFLYSRASEEIEKLQSGNLAYDDFDESLRGLLVVDSVRGLNNRQNFMEASDRLPYVESEVQKIAGFRGDQSTFSHIGFSPTGSNVNSQDIPQFFGKLGIKKPWRRLSNISRRIGSSHIDIEQAYKNFNTDRNLAAHDALHNIPTNNLKGHIDAANAVAISFDILLTFSISQICTSTDLQSAHHCIRHSTIPIRFIEQVGKTTWRDYPEGAARARKRFDTMEEAVRDSKPRNPNVFFVIRDSDGKNINLF